VRDTSYSLLWRRGVLLACSDTINIIARINMSTITTSTVEGAGSDIDAVVFYAGYLSRGAIFASLQPGASEEGRCCRGNGLIMGALMQYYITRQHGGTHRCCIFDYVLANVWRMGDNSHEGTRSLLTWKREQRACLWRAGRETWTAPSPRRIYRCGFGGARRMTSVLPRPSPA